LLSGIVAVATAVRIPSNATTRSNAPNLVSLSLLIGTPRYAVAAQMT
jgi:hypothetical protein